MRMEWSAVIAHDLRQPVGVIALATELARRSHPGPVDAMEAKQLDRIAGANERLREMIEELLDVTLLEARRLSIAPAKIDVGGIAHEVCERMLSTSAGRPVTVREAGDSRTAWADPGRVEQVISNLLSNACKYGDPGTEVRIEVDGREDDIEVTVTNRGRGISPEEQSRLFRRFMRSRESKASGVAGIGLGLYICKGLVEAHGGRMWVESTSGESTSFHFTLPARPMDRAADTDVCANYHAELGGQATGA
jgi:signal transduction histidine kinase